MRLRRATCSTDAPVNTQRVTAFRGHQQLAAGPLRDVARVVWHSLREAQPSLSAVLVFDDATGHVIDLEMRGDESDMLAHLEASARRHSTANVDAALAPVAVGDAEQAGGARRARGRPRLGVVAKEVTLLPRHWAWLGGQPGGASVALRRLVDDARRANAATEHAHAARDAAYRFMHAVAGNLSQFEEASRALYRDDRDRLGAILDAWPRDLRAFVLRLLDQPAPIQNSPDPLA